MSHEHYRRFRIVTYSSRSAAYIFGERVGDRDADAILEALRSVENGLTRDEIRNQVFNRNAPSHRIGQKLKVLAVNGLAKSTKVSSGKAGRPTERWVACDPHAENALITQASSSSTDYRVNDVDLPSDDDPPVEDVCDEEDSDIERQHSNSRLAVFALKTRLF